MVDCFDRIHLKLNEVVLRPLKALQEQSTLTSVTIRPPGRGPRIHVTINKTWPTGPDHPPSYVWSAHEAPSQGANGQTWAGQESHTSAEAAYWSALDTVAASLPRSGQTV